MTDTNEQNDGIEVAISELAQAEIAKVRTSLPAEVISYDHDTQKATLRPTVQLRRENPQTGEDKFYTPVVQECPVAFPSSDDYSIAWPISRGSTGRIHFQSRDIDNWLTAGGSDRQPDDPRRHDVQDGVFVPGLRSFAEALSDNKITSEGMVIFVTDQLRLGDADAEQFVALAQAVADKLQRVEQAFQSSGHTHTYTQPAIPASPAPTGPANNGAAVAPNTSKDEIRSDKVKASEN